MRLRRGDSSAASFSRDAEITGNSARPGRRWNPRLIQRARKTSPSASHGGYSFRLQRTRSGRTLQRLEGTVFKPAQCVFIARKGQADRSSGDAAGSVSGSASGTIGAAGKERQEREKREKREERIVRPDERNAVGPVSLIKLFR